MGVDAYAAAPLQAPEEAPGGYAPDLSPAGYSVDGPVGPVVEPGTLNDLVIRVVPAHGGKDTLDAAIQDTDMAKPLTDIVLDQIFRWIDIPPLVRVARLCHEAAGDGVDLQNVRQIGRNGATNHGKAPYHFSLFTHYTMF